MHQIEASFVARGLRLSASNGRQAYIPAGAIPAENPVGTAPAFIVEHHNKTAITLPGVPREMEYLLVNGVIPYLRQRLGVRGERRRRVLKTVGGAGLASGRLAAAAPEVFAGGVVLTDPSEAERLGLDAGGVERSEERARALALAVAKWAGASVGAASLLEPAPGTSPAMVRAIVGVSAYGAQGGACEYRFGGDPPSMRIRAATLLLDLIRRTLPAEPR